MQAYLFGIGIAVSLIALIYARYEYRKRGILSLLGLFLLCAMLFVPNLILHYEASYAMPTTTIDFVGVVVAIFGGVVCLASIVGFRSVSKVLCIDTGKLTLTGLYRWSRNPQYVGWLLFLLGWALMDWSWWSLGALLIVAISLHLLVLIEEEHLRQAFGEPYEEFCRAVPRYLG